MSVRDVAYSPSGKYIASASMDGEVRLWSSTHGVLVGDLPVSHLFFHIITTLLISLNAFITIMLTLILFCFPVV